MTGGKKNQVCNSEMLFLSLHIGVISVFALLTGIEIASALFKGDSKESPLNNISVLFSNLKVNVWLR